MYPGATRVQCGTWHVTVPVTHSTSLPNRLRVSVVLFSAIHVRVTWTLFVSLVSTLSKLYFLVNGTPCLHGHVKEVLIFHVMGYWHVMFSFYWY